ncbi:Signal recognition particle receptor subunit alpha [Monoraphidium neglectum]|uniref:Signal recognition particle receptor subunit alpha n=1 Tax=Monoraphidium neglectum TaxID=145388 RepID=A0A0D2NPP5_9CHLO|nr:Signal recognition particle receptor subunit alpha [Monoraphidium neglectum]KIZ06391.1 Signal recognition particle receptor subunit alpha [Monoraphidium neglectum]|eukprot:XP_013905410.1 Signal recognition particle receptor subunit alpha [Monoraphidium neglectum]
MLDYFAIFTKGGALLWTLQFTAALKHSPIDALNALVRGCLLEERASDAAFTYQPKTGAAQSLKWTFHNGLGLVFVAAYQRTLSLLYVDELLATVRDAFATEHYKPGGYDYSAFTRTFEATLKDCEARSDASRRAAAAPARAPAGAKGGQQRGGAGKSGGGAMAGAAQQSGDADDDADDAAAKPAAVGNGAGTPLGSSSSGDEDEGAANKSGGGFDISKLKAKSRKALGGPKGRSQVRRGTREEEEEKKRETASPDKKKKQNRHWNGGAGGGSADDLPRLDYSAATANGGASAGGAPPADAGASRMEDDEDDGAEWSDEEEDAAAGAGANGRGAGAAAAGPAKAKGVLGSFMSKLALRVAGSSALSREDLQPALEDMQRKLMERNVAEEIAVQVCESVAQSLVGQKLSSFTGVKTFVLRAFEDSLSGILNKRAVDVLHDVQRQRAKGRPYVVVFCGVNGVGKSTNLAKIAYWLGQHGLKVQLAACDTFRAGAVEQLKTHAMRLGVPLYERGYEKDPAKVAAEAIRVAERDGRDVVLVDTAGRMQDNEPLMRALSSLIHVNSPNLVLFVGEALVGNDAVDQLVKFNRALHDLAPSTATRGHMIDGIVLTKFDTIDDKVGAALSMVYASGAPVMFVGCGQTYVDLKKLNVKSVVRSLLS